MEVCVVIFIYSNNIKQEERVAIDHNLHVLRNYPCRFVYPTGFDIQPLHQAYPWVDLLEVSDEWLGLKNGIAGYNKMMLSEEFYKLFDDYEYIFICHSDAWIFRDELSQWCRKGYDLVAAPWPTRPRYKHFPLKQILRLRILLKPKHKILHCQQFGRIGNGGLCLRKIEKFREACVTYKDEIDYYNSNPQETNEDSFWAIIPKDFNVPTEEEALHFAFDAKPKLAYELNHHNLPMGCHGFNKPSRFEFWRPFAFYQDTDNQDVSLNDFTTLAGAPTATL